MSVITIPTSDQGVENKKLWAMMSKIYIPLQGSKTIVVEGVAEKE